MNILAVYLAVDEMKATLGNDAPRQDLRPARSSQPLAAFAALAAGLAAAFAGLLG